MDLTTLKAVAELGFAGLATFLVIFFARAFTRMQQTEASRFKILVELITKNAVANTKQAAAMEQLAGTVQANTGVIEDFKETFEKYHQALGNKGKEG